jgi:hypothetical protein
MFTGPWGPVALTTQHPSLRKSRHYFADSGGRSVGIVHLRTKATEFSLVFSFIVFTVLYKNLILAVCMVYDNIWNFNMQFNTFLLAADTYFTPYIQLQIIHWYCAIIFIW